MLHENFKVFCVLDIILWFVIANEILPCVVVLSFPRLIFYIYSS
jgi:hypothetical protein